MNWWSWESEWDYDEFDDDTGSVHVYAVNFYKYIMIRIILLL